MTRVYRFIAEVLPRDARDALVAAAATDPHRPPLASRQRMLEVDDAIKRIRTKYPEFFKIEKE